MASNQADHILSAAAHLCLNRGLGALTMRSAASAAQVTSSAIVYHFKTREQLLVAILYHLTRGIDEGRQRLVTAFDGEQADFAGSAALVAAILCQLLHEQGRAVITMLEIARLL